MAHYDERLKSGGLVLSGVLSSLVVLGKKTYMRITAGAFGGPISRRLGAESGLGELVLMGSSRALMKRTVAGLVLMGLHVYD